MPKSVFVSHIYEEKPFKDKLDRWARDGRLGNATVTGETHDVRQGGQRAIKQHLSPRLKGAGALLVMVGNDSHDRPWLDYEVQHARSHGKKIVAVRVPGTSGAAPRSIRNAQEVAFEPGAIRRALD